MNSILAILAHESAQPTLDDFRQRWASLNIPTILYLPVGHVATGFADTRNIGESAHAGYKVFRRFLDTLIDLWRIHSQHPNGWFIIAEYDTVNLRPELPKMTDGAITAHLVMAHRHGQHSGPMQLCALSPWVMDRWTLGQFVAAGEELLKIDPDGADVCGLLDRWIGKVMEFGKIRGVGGSDMMGYPWHPGAHDRIRHMRYNWIHGWKRKEDFEELWNLEPI